MTTRSDHGPSALQRIHALCWNHALSVPSDVRAVQVLIRNALSALSSNPDGVESLVEHKQMCDANRARLKASLKVSENKLSDAQHLLKERELTKDTVEQLATKV